MERVEGVVGGGDAVEGVRDVRLEIELAEVSSSCSQVTHSQHKSKRVLARVKLDTATVDHVALDTSFSPAAAGGYQGPEWAAPAVA